MGRRFARMPSAERIPAMSAVPESTILDSSTKVGGLRSQYGAGLMGVPREGLRLSWRVESDRAGTRQVAYELASSAEGAETVSHGIVDGAASVGIAVPG